MERIMSQRWAVLLLVVIAIAAVTGCSGREEARQPAAAEDASLSYQSMFSSSVFMGDSIIGGLTNDDLLDTVNVMGGLGATVEFTLENVDELARRKPEYVFLSLGQNDIREPVEESEAIFGEQYAELVRAVQAKLPHANIYILSITPLATDDPRGALSNDNIDRFNSVLRGVAETEQVGYIDLAPIFTRHQIQYDGDGSHFRNDFYPLLLDYVMEQTDIADQPPQSAVIDTNDKYKQLFRNRVFMGDSIIGALAYLDKLDKEQVIAPSGATLDLLQLNIARLADLQPEHIYILIGSNDIRLIDRPEFIAKYETFIRSMKENLPSARIHVMSITPVADEALSQEPRYQHIAAYNESLQQLAAAEEVQYIDLSPIFANNTIAYAHDGVRFTPDFYSLLLDYLKNESNGE